MTEKPALTMAAVLRSLALPAYIPVLFLTFVWSSLSPAFPQYLGGLGAGMAAVGLIVSMKGIGQVASDLPGGFILAAWGLRRITIISYLLAVAANSVLVFSRSLPVITALTFASGFSTSILLTTVMTTVRMKVPAEFRGRALAGVGGAVRVGMLIGPVVGGYIAQNYGVPAIFLLRIAGLVAGLLFFMAGMPADATSVAPAASPAAAAAVFSRRTIRTPFSYQHLWSGLKGRWYAVATVGFGILVLSVLRASREIILPLWGEEIGLSPLAIGGAMSVGAAFDLLLFMPAGIISDRWGRKISAGVCLGIFSLGLFALLPAGTAGLYIAAAALIGFGNGLGAGINMTTGADLAPDGAVPEFLGLWRLYGDVGSAAGPLLVGVLAASLALGPAVAITGAVGLTGMVVILGIAPETRDLR